MSKKLYQLNHINILIPAQTDLHFDGSTEIPFTTIKEKLCAEKTKIDDYVKNKNYSAIQSALDLYRPLIPRIKKEFGAQVVTNAWLKYYEIYSHYNLAKMFNEPLKVFCNAELPGASICALNHYARTHDVKYTWFASSLAPDREKTQGAYADALGDYYGLWRKNPQNWLMSTTSARPSSMSTTSARPSSMSTTSARPSSMSTTSARPQTTRGGSNREEKYINTGDATIYANLEDYAKRIGPESEVGGVHVYSHDAGIDSSTDYNNQETLNAQIHLGCALAGFMTLRQGGMFIAKQYTFFEPLTYGLIAIYASMFEKFYIDKPLTSRPYNSEIYLVGLGFKGLPDRVHAYLKALLQDFKMRSVCAIPKNTQDAILDAGATIFGQQIKMVMEMNALHGAHARDSRDELNGLARMLSGPSTLVCDKWLSNYPVKRIKSGELLPYIIKF